MGTQELRDRDKNEFKIESEKYVYDKVNGWIENADNKVNISCGIFVGIFGVITFLSEKIVPSEEVNEYWRTIYHWSFAISLGLMLVSILYYVLAINPNLGKSGKVTSKKFPVFYGDIAEMTSEEYQKAMSKASEQEFINELQDEIHYNSKVCNRKMRRYKTGLWLSLAAVFFSSISWVTRFLMYRS